MKSLIAALAVACLVGCSSSSTPVRPSLQHARNLHNTVTRSLEKQECEDRAQQCFLEVCNYYQEACNAEPAYCHLENWMHACIDSCVRKAKVCEAK